VASTASLPLLLNPPFRLHFGFIIAILATVFVWWLMERSTVGFEFRAAGANPVPPGPPESRSTR
jgi:nucleoside ABC transporter membrane protein